MFYKNFLFALFALTGIFSQTAHAAHIALTRTTGTLIARAAQAIKANPQISVPAAIMATAAAVGVYEYTKFDREVTKCKKQLKIAQDKNAAAQTIGQLEDFLRQAERRAESAKKYSFEEHLRQNIFEPNWRSPGFMFALALYTGALFYYLPKANAKQLVAQKTAALSGLCGYFPGYQATLTPVLPNSLQPILQLTPEKTPAERAQAILKFMAAQPVVQNKLKQQIFHTLAGSSFVLCNLLPIAAWLKERNHKAKMTQYYSY